MTPSEPATACIISTSRDHPIQLWDAFSGKVYFIFIEVFHHLNLTQLRCTYRKYDQMDEIHAAYGVCFNPSGEKYVSPYVYTCYLFTLNLESIVGTTESLVIFIQMHQEEISQN